MSRLPVRLSCARRCAGFAEIRAIADGLSRTVTYAYNTSNELCSVTDHNGTVSVAYDEWGRIASKTRGTDTLTYDWAYDNKLIGVDGTNWPGMGGSVSYAYRGDGRRHSRTEASATTEYHWAGWSLTNEERSASDVRTYVGTLAHFDGTSGTLGTPAYYTHDHLGSTRGLYDSAENLLGQQEFTPYGTMYLDGMPNETMAFTGHQREALTGDYYAPYRYDLSPTSVPIEVRGFPGPVVRGFVVPKQAGGQSRQSSGPHVNTSLNTGSRSSYSCFAALRRSLTASA